MSETGADELSKAVAEAVERVVSALKELEIALVENFEPVVKASTKVASELHEAFKNLEVEETDEG